jgi:hypothetical protein
MSTEDKLILIAVFSFCALVYAIVFTISYIKNQNVTVYVAFFAIQLLLLLYELFGYAPSKIGSIDAMASGMREAYFHILLLGLQVILSFTVLVILLVRVSSVVFWKRFALVSAAITAIFIVAYKLYTHYKDNANKVTVYYGEEDINYEVSATDSAIIEEKYSNWVRKLIKIQTRIDSLFTELGFEVENIDGYIFYSKNNIHYKIIGIYEENALIIQRHTGNYETFNDLFKEDIYSASDEDELIENIRNDLTNKK